MSQWSASSVRRATKTPTYEESKALREDSLALHLTLPSPKSVGYLPLTTISRYHGLSIGEYIRRATANGYAHLIVPEDESRIAPGAVYVFDEGRLGTLLAAHADVLNRAGWPVAPAAFVRQAAWVWVAEGHPVLPVIREAFGDHPQPISASG